MLGILSVNVGKTAGLDTGRDGPVKSRIAKRRKQCVEKIERTFQTSAEVFGRICAGKIHSLFEDRTL